MRIFRECHNSVLYQGMVFRSQIVLYFECFCIAWNMQTALFNITACNVFHCTYYFCVYKDEMGCYRCVCMRVFTQVYKMNKVVKCCV